MRKEEDAAAFVVAVRLNELVPGKIKVVQLAGRHIAVGLVGDEVFAFDDRCSHAGSSFAAGRVIRGCLICPMHGAMFDPRTGACTNAPYSPLKRYETRIVEGLVEVAAH